MPGQSGCAGAVVRGQVGEVTVVIAHQPGARAVAATSVRAAGTTAERPGEASFAHLAEHLVHQYARTDTGELVEEIETRVGGISNAQTYPFHTEFTFAVPAGSADEIRRWFSCATGRLRWPEVGDSEAATERAVIVQEVIHRRATSPVAGFPWIDALGTLSDDFGLAHDGFTDLTDLDGAVSARLRTFWDRTGATASMSVGMATPWHPAEVACLLGLQETAHGAANFCPAFTAPRKRTASVLTRLPMRAEVRWLPDPPDQPRERSRALALLAAGVLNLHDDTGQWQTGLFGPCLGPDHGLIVLRTAAPAMPTRRWPNPTARQVEEARRIALMDLGHLLGSTATYAALLARDAVYGIDPVETMTYLRTVSPTEVIEVLDRVAATEPGHLATPGMLGEGLV